MELFQITYYTGLVTALYLCWNLGPLFYSYVLWHILTDVLLDVGWLAHGDMRMKWATILWMDGIWILILANIFRSRLEAILVSALVMIAVGVGVYPRLTDSADSWPQWVALTTEIMRAWAVINFTVVSFVIAKTLYRWKTKQGPNDLVVNPRRRFLLPIWAFAAIVAMPMGWIPWQQQWFEAHRFQIAAPVQAWGWVLVELKFFLQARKWRKKYGREGNRS